MRYILNEDGEFVIKKGTTVKDLTKAVMPNDLPKQLLIEGTPGSGIEVIVPSGTFTAIAQHLAAGNPPSMVQLCLEDDKLFQLSIINDGSDYIFSLSGELDEGFQRIVVWDDDTAELYTTNLPLIKTVSGSVSGWTIPAGSRAVQAITLSNIPSGYSFGAYKSIALNSATGDGEGFKSCAIQFFGSAGGGTKANIAIKNFANVDVKINVTVEVLFFKN